jgi:signal transduction histidine kinase/AmiR/NasT family two-component response regulator
MGQPIPAESCCAGPTCEVAAPVESSFAGFFGNLFNTSTYPPRWECGSWSTLEGWLHIVSDLMIFAAYFAIPVALVYFILKRRDFPFHSIFFLFGGFILLCGLTHAVEAIIFYYPIYRVQGLLKLATGIVSVCTFLVLLRLLPKLLDLPELATINAKLREASTAKSNFLANMSHEIRTPMTAILGYTDILLENPTESEREAASQVIKSNGEHLLAIVNDILDISKIEAERIHVEKSSVDTKEFILGSVSLMQVQADAKKIKLSTKLIDPIPPTVSLDRTRVRQVLINIVGNAIKFTERGGVSTTVKFDPVASELSFLIKDTGAGMTPETLQRLGEPFYQADNSICRNHGGTGLGMAICFRLVELMGGRMHVESRLNLGTQVEFQIPVDVAESSPTGLADVTLHTASRMLKDLPLIGLRILLAEDGPDNQRLISHLLKKAGAEVEVVENGALAVQRILQKDFDVKLSDPACDAVLMDMQMPVLDGYQATKKLRDSGCRLPIIAVTAHALSEDEQKCLAAGCDAYVTKPINKNQLLAVIQAQISKTHLTAK